ncbi:MAG: 5'-3' exonuclease [Sciscionella sp.]
MTAPLALLDAASLYFRAFYALPDSMTAPDGRPVNAVRGFTDTLTRIIADRAPSRMVVCLDADWRPRFRVEALPSYKAHRVAAGQNAEDVPDTLTPQVPIILEVLAAAGLASAEAVGFEADDVIGTLTHRERRSPVEVITGDRDLLQVVRTDPTEARVIYVGKGWAKAEVMGEAEVAAKYRVPVRGAGEAYADMSMLRGDPSDGLPGVQGIGEKTAAALITEFGSLAALRAAATADDARITARARSALQSSSEYLDAAPTVVRVATDAPVTLSTSDEIPFGTVDEPALRALQSRWGLGGSIDRLLTALRR